MNTLTAEGRQAIAVTRKLAVRNGLTGKIGPGYLAAGLARALGAKSEEHLKKAGIADPIDMIKAIPAATEAELASLPAVVPDERLTCLMKGGLAPFLEGTLNADEALQIILAQPGIVAELTQAIQAPDGRKDSKPIADILRCITLNFQKGYRYGKLRYSADNEYCTSDFSTGQLDREFERIMTDFNREKLESRILLYGNRPNDRCSVFETYMRIHGPLQADILSFVVVNSLTPFVEKGGPPLVREVAWTLDPQFFHRSVAEVVQGVRALAEARLLRILPEPDHCHLESCVLPSETLMEEVTGYIRDVTQSESQT